MGQQELKEQMLNSFSQSDAPETVLVATASSSSSTSSLSSSVSSQQCQDKKLRRFLRHSPSESELLHALFWSAKQPSKLSESVVRSLSFPTLCYDASDTCAIIVDDDNNSNNNNNNTTINNNNTIDNSSSSEKKKKKNNNKNDDDDDASFTEVTSVGNFHQFIEFPNDEESEIED